jgi:hypothetical protein
MRQHEFATRRRLFKKLCKRAHALMIRIEPQMAAEAFRSTKDEPPAMWLGYSAAALPGTWGFGRVSGYYEPEWDDESAWDALKEALYWHLVEISEATDYVPRWPANTPHLGDWRDVLRVGERVALEVEANRIANAARLAA